MTARSDVGMEPINDEARAGSGSGLQGAVAQLVSHQFTADDLQLKEFAMLSAQLKVRGYTLALNGSGACYFGRWGFVKTLDGLAGVAAFASKVGAI